jgi:hypothetical protein
MLSCAFYIGSSSPLILGILKPRFGLSTSLSYLSFFYILGAFLIGISAFVFFNRDNEKVVNT